MNRKVSDTRGLLLVAGNLLGLTLLITWYMKDSAVDRELAVKPIEVTPARIAQVPSGSSLPLDLIQSRALFHASRAFYVAPVTPLQPVEVKPPRPAYKVATVLVSPGKPAVALLTGPQGKGVIKVHRGDVLEGWTVDSITPGRVTLTIQDDRIELGPKLTGPDAQPRGMTQTAGTPQSAPATPQVAMVPPPPGTSEANPTTAADTASVANAQPRTVIHQLAGVLPGIASVPGRPGQVRVLGGGTAASTSPAPMTAPRLFQPPPH